MRKYLYLVLLSALVVACVSGTKTKEEGERVLTVTIEPQRFFLDHIVGDAFTVNTLVPPGTSPETYEPAPSVMVDMAKSDIYFMVGDLGFENAWSERLAENNPNLRIVNCSNGIDRMEGECHHHDHGDAHSHDHGDDHDHGHFHGHSHGGIDPHVWSSPSASKVIVKNMLEAVVELDPDNADTYRANYEMLVAKIERTDSLIRDLLSEVPSKSFIIYHPALGYFARDYGLQQHSMEFEGKNPSPAQIRALVDLAKKEQINTVFIQREFDTKNASVMAKEIGAEAFEIDPLRYEWDEELLNIASILARKAHQ